MKDPAAELVRDIGRLVENAVVFATVDSTHAAALRLIDQVDCEELTLRPTVLLAESQSHGLGRGGRRWASPAGGLYLSWVASMADERLIALMPMLAASAALRAIEEAGVTGAAIKWPNDVLVAGCKLAGILVHARRGEVDCVTVGLGVNVDPVTEPLDDALHPPVSLAELIGHETARQRSHAVAVRFVSALTEALAEPGSALEHWRRSLIHLIGDRLSVRVASGAIRTGSFQGLTDDGHLRLAIEGGQEMVVTGGDVVELG